MHEIPLYFDFLSPYSALALFQAEEFAATHKVRFLPRPVPLARLLDAAGRKGTGEIPAQRKYSSADMLRVADRLGIEFPGPKAHPFLSLNALRAVCIFQEDPEAAMALTIELFRRGWQVGEDLTQAAVLEAGARAVGLDAHPVEDRILDREVKGRLKANIREAVALEIFGVPTFTLGEELFWGQDRLPDLAQRLSGATPSPLKRAAALMARPQGTDRTKLNQ